MVDVLSAWKKKGKYYLCNGGSDFSSLYTIKNGKAITHEYFNCHSAKGTDRTNQSVFKKDKKIIKNLGYLNTKNIENTEILIKLWNLLSFLSKIHILIEKAF